MYCPIPTAPKLASVTGTNSSYDFQYNGGSPVTAIHILAGIRNVLAEYTTNLITNATITSRDFSATDLQYEESEYEHCPIVLVKEMVLYPSQLISS